MPAKLPPWVATHSAARADEEAEEYARLTPAERWVRFVEIQRLTERFFAANPEARAAAELRDEVSPASRKLWRRLMAAYRRPGEPPHG